MQTSWKVSLVLELLVFYNLRKPVRCWEQGVIWDPWGKPFHKAALMWCSPWTTLGSQQLKSLKSSSAKIKFQWPSKNARAGGSKRGQRLFLLPVRLCFGATFPHAVKFPPPMHVHIFHPAQAWLTQGEHNTLFGVSSCDINGNSLPGAQRNPFPIPESVSQPFLWRSCFVT